MNISKMAIIVSIVLSHSALAAINGSGNYWGGNNLNIDGDSNYAHGKDVVVNGNNSTAVGIGVQINANNAVAIGVNDTNNRDNTFSVGSDDNKRQVTNVAAGTQSTDAVNVQQLQNGMSKTLTVANSYTDNKIKNINTASEESLNNTYNKSVNYTNSRIDGVSSRIDGVSNQINSVSKTVSQNRKRASAGISGAMAMSSIPQNMSYDFNFGMGMANFDSEQAISAGGYYRVNDRTIVSLKASFDTQDNLGAAAGVSYGW